MSFSSLGTIFCSDSKANDSWILYHHVIVFRYMIHSSLLVLHFHKYRSPTTTVDHLNFPPKGNRLVTNMILIWFHFFQFPSHCAKKVSRQKIDWYKKTESHWTIILFKTFMAHFGCSGRAVLGYFISLASRVWASLIWPGDDLGYQFLPVFDQFFC